MSKQLAGRPALGVFPAWPPPYLRPPRGVAAAPRAGLAALADAGATAGFLTLMVSRMEARGLLSMLARAASEPVSALARGPRAGACDLAGGGIVMAGARRPSPAGLPFASDADHDGIRCLSPLPIRSPRPMATSASRRMGQLSGSW